jgi:hypothetical protein
VSVVERTRILQVGAALDVCIYIYIYIYIYICDLPLSPSFTPLFPSTPFTRNKP